jgi:hypothetical protein
MPPLDVPTRFEPPPCVRVVDTSNGYGTPTLFKFSGLVSRGSTTTGAGTGGIESLVVASAKMANALAFLPVNPEHERIVDQMVAERLRGVSTRKLPRRNPPFSGR